ncbi:MAG: 5-methyltetrahydropteroyltriglutamate--homocysteine methyltransferase [Chloroflexi bacterium ADurb.Bin222]|nr:MAG: 5-methyltetrahydropteroyltriglutamate--homocysteine methyltransferase [Chloroflexi bacterium ADurb.Bin222]
MTASHDTQTVGYPRIGKNRELKRALEAFWKRETDADTLLATFQQVEEDGWRTQRDAGIDHIGVGDATLYDHVLDWSVRLGLIPARFAALQGLDRYFAMARGAEGIPALEMTKWFDTNYHYLVPEITADVSPTAHFAEFLARIQRAQALLGERTVPIVLGPVTMLRLAHLEIPFEAALAQWLPLYVELLASLKALGVREVQLHEPALILPDVADSRPQIEAAAAALAAVGLPLNLVIPFDDVGDAFPWIAALPVAGLTLDFTRGETAALLERYGWPADKFLAAGVVDGRSVWRVRGADVLPLLRELAGYATLRLSPSCSLQFVPYSTARETALPAPLHDVLAFAEEKLHELVALRETVTAARPWDDSPWERFRAFAPAEVALQQRLASLTAADFSRTEPYAARRPQQLALPPFPLTTIGSFPQTAEVRQLRARFKRGELSEAAYRAALDGWIAYTVGVQEGLGFDVLVHGEFERSDMVEYFAEKLTGFAFTQHGWVQSFGSRYVRPPIIYADVTRPAPMTVREFEVAQSFTRKPVKGMLTGPVTLLNWSFPRTDIPRQEVAFQLALALRAEIADLERAGARVIQVDEPALREGLPFKPDRRAAYLAWTVDAFRLATGGAASATQLHTHMCYAEFGDVLPAIDRLDADVISLENARSGDETLRALAEYGYAREVGPGVYDIHSPVIPDDAFILEKLRVFRRHLADAQIWVNPDCGLKTRTWAEVLPALRALVAAVQRLRAELGKAGQD